MRNKVLIAGTALSLFLSGCSMMPYHDNFMCQGGSNIHICKRVSDVYEESEYGNLTNKKNNHKNIANNNTGNNCKDLKNIIEAISYTKLKNPIEVVVVKEKSKNNNQKILNTQNKANKTIPLNKLIKVCVYNANIRTAPSCKAAIVRVAHKGEKLYGYYIKGAWIKVKDGYIHKSLVCGECKCKEVK
jgi:hypothetical protein